MILSCYGPGLVVMSRCPAAGFEQAAWPSDLAGRKVRLRPLAAADRPVLVGFDRDAARAGDPRVGGYRHWAAHRAGAGDNLHLVIETLHGRMVVGSVSVTRGEPFSYGIGIGHRHRRCGYAADAITALLAHMFTSLGHDRCEVGIYGGNLGSLSLHGALGFREQARSSDADLLRGRVRNLVLMGISAEAFTASRPAGAAAVRGRHWRARRGRHWLGRGGS